jgi:alpha-galactosidase
VSKRVINAPPMGWNSFDSYGCHLYEEVALREINAISSKLRPFGYEYFVIDNGWFAEQELMDCDGYKIPADLGCRAEHVCIDAYGIPVPAPCFFPRGMPFLAEACKQKGLKLGLHLMRGIPRKAVELNTPIKGTSYYARDIAVLDDTCCWCSYMYGIDATKPGAQEYLNSVFDAFCEWGVEFVKIDFVTRCPDAVEAYVKAMEQCPGEICLSLSPGTSNKRYYETYRQTQMLRITSDVWDLQKDIDKGFAAWNLWQGLEHEDFYPDLDMIPFGELCILRREANLHKSGDALFAGEGLRHFSAFSDDQKETFITQRALSASPLMYGGSVVSMDDKTAHLLTNRDMLACNQNGVMGLRQYADDELEVYLTPVKERAHLQPFPGVKRGWLGVFNRTASDKHVQLKQGQLGLNPLLQSEKAGVYRLRDIWRNTETEVGSDKPLDVVIPARGVAFYAFDKI